jgi:putative transposase
VKRPGSEILDLTLWSTTDFSVLGPNARQRYQDCATAIEFYSRGLSIGEVEERTQVDRRTLYRLIERALRWHPDGRPWGFRALIPSLRTVAYERRKTSKGKGKGLSGAFGQLLDGNRELERLLRELIQSREVMLVQRGDRFFVKGLNTAHSRFTAVCRSLGLTAEDYPLNQDEQGRRSLGNTLRHRMLERFGAATRSAGSERVKPAAALKSRGVNVVTDPFDTVEFDAHKLDLRLKVLDQDPYGDEQAFEIERVWLLALIDIGTRAIIGYTLCLRREYGRYDVIRTLEKALAPAQPPAITIPELQPISSGGFVSEVLPETAYVCWRKIRFDNARAHPAADSLDVACELLGCTVDVGPAYEPDDRPFIERFFGTVATRFTHRLPGTTGSTASDVLRLLKDPGNDLRLVVSLDELRELLAVWVMNYNGTPHGGLGSGRTPLEAMRAAIRDRRILLRHLPQALRGNLCLLQSAHSARVRGHVGRGDKPHVSFYHVRYTNERLARTPELIGKRLRIYYDADDIRVLRAFLADGTEFGELKAGGLWSVTPHSLEVRKRIFKAKRLRQLHFGQWDDPVQAYLDFKRGKVKRSRRAASEIAQIQDRIKAKHTSIMKPAASANPLPLAIGPVKARRLRIPSGFA